MARKPYGSEWRRVRRLVLARDRFRCQIGLEGCLGEATDVDHMDPVGFYGPSYDPARLRAACSHCNRVLGGQVALVKWRAASEAGSAGPSREW